MYIVLLHLHSIFRWLLLLSLVFALVKFMSGWFGNQPWRKIDNYLSGSVVWLADLLLLTGLLLYFIYSPLTGVLFTNFSAAMKDPGIRFYAVEHFFLMMIAIVFIHIARFKAKNAESDLKKFKFSAVFLLIALMFIYAAIPWGMS